MISAILVSGPHLAQLVASLLWISATLGRRVRKARRAFEKQLVAEGMSSEDARRISAFYEELKDSLIQMSMRGMNLRSHRS
jgi:hypothetical protein